MHSSGHVYDPIQAYEMAIERYGPELSNERAFVEIYEADVEIWFAKC